MRYISLKSNKFCVFYKRSIHFKPLETLFQIYVPIFESVLHVYSHIVDDAKSFRKAVNFNAENSTSSQGRNEVRWRPRQEVSLTHPCSNLRSFGSKCTV